MTFDGTDSRQMFPCCLWLLVVLAVGRAGLEAAPPPGYYVSAQGQTGAVLRLALHNIIKGQRVCVPG